MTRRSRGRIWRIIMILVLILLGVVDLGGVLPPLPNVVVPPDARSRNDDAGATIRDAQRQKPAAGVVKLGTQRGR